jgi:hypothetical protein
MALLSSNTHVMDYLTGARKHSSEGEIRRVLELTLTNIISWEPTELEAMELLKNNYGVAGDVYVQYLVRQRGFRAPTDSGRTQATEG